MKKLACLFLLLFVSCESDKTGNQGIVDSTASKTIETVSGQSITLKSFIKPCDENSTRYDSLFFKTIYVQLTETCITGSFVTDTSVNSDGIKAIYSYPNTEFLIDFKINDKHHKVVFSKFESLDAAGYPDETLLNSVFGKPVFERFDYTDTTLYFKVFFGFPDSDNGEAIRFKANKKEAVFVEFIESDNIED